MQCDPSSASAGEENNVGVRPKQPGVYPSAKSKTTKRVLTFAIDRNDISSNSWLFGDADAGGLRCDGALYSAGKTSDCTAATAGELQIDLDATKRTAAFRQQGRLLGEVTGLPSAVKLVVSLYRKDQFVTLL